MKIGNKYYVPEIEEFHVDFEYEYLDGIWHKATPTDISRKDYDKQKDGIRVKYLDKEDIESLGWILQKDYSTEYIFQYNWNHEGFYELELDKDYKTLTISYYMEKGDGNYTEFEKFNGIIKNKSELKKLMNQLGIECKKD